MLAAAQETEESGSVRGMKIGVGAKAVAREGERAGAVGKRKVKEKSDMGTLN